MQETADQACGRIGLAAAAFSLQLLSSSGLRLQWNASAVAAITAGLGHSVAPGGVVGCCVPSLYCVANATAGGDGIQCGTQMYATEFSNAGWLPLDAPGDFVPVYACSPLPTLAYTPPTAPMIALVTPTIASISNTSFIIDGVDLGNESLVITAQVGDTQCDQVSVCHTICTECDAARPCSSGYGCFRSPSSTKSYCLPECSAVDNFRCPCGGKCVPYNSGAAASRLVCLNPDYSNTSMCSPTHPWAPDASTGLNSRVDCTISQPTLKQCTTTGAQQVALTVYGEPAMTVPGSAVTAPNVTFAFPVCTTDAHCGEQTLCYKFTCVSGCCVPESTGRCDAESPLNPGPQTSVRNSGFVLLPAAVAVGLALPDLGPGDNISAVSYVDDSPMERQHVNFTFNMYGTQTSDLFLSPNGYLQLDSTPQCNGGAFSVQGCSLLTRYKGLVAPLLADFEPSIYQNAVVWVRKGPQALCVEWENMPSYRPSHVVLPLDPLYTMTVCLYPPSSLRWMYRNFTHPPALPWLVSAAVAMP